MSGIMPYTRGRQPAARGRHAALCNFLRSPPKHQYNFRKNQQT